MVLHVTLGYYSFFIFCYISYFVLLCNKYPLSIHLISSNSRINKFLHFQNFHGIHILVTFFLPFLCLIRTIFFLACRCSVCVTLQLLRYYRGFFHGDVAFFHGEVAFFLVAMTSLLVPPSSSSWSSM